MSRCFQTASLAAQQLTLTALKIIRYLERRILDFTAANKYAVSIHLTGDWYFLRLFVVKEQKSYITRKSQADITHPQLKTSNHLTPIHNNPSTSNTPNTTPHTPIPHPLTPSHNLKQHPRPAPWHPKKEYQIYPSPLYPMPGPQLPFPRHREV